MKMSPQKIRRMHLEELGENHPPDSPLRRLIHQIKDLGMHRRGGTSRVLEMCRTVDTISKVIKEFRAEITLLKSQRDFARQEVCEFGCTTEQSQAYAKWRRWDCYSPQKNSFEI
jgi:hypothetical protein